METQKRKSIRGQKRLKVVIMATIMTDGTAMDITMHELSISGAKVTGKLNQFDKLKGEFRLLFKLNTSEFNIKCKSVWIRNTNESSIMGVKFLDISIIQQNIIRRFIDKNS